MSAQKVEDTFLRLSMSCRLSEEVLSRFWICTCDLTSFEVLLIGGKYRSDCEYGGYLFENVCSITGSDTNDLCCVITKSSCFCLFWSCGICFEMAKKFMLLIMEWNISKLPLFAILEIYM